MRSNLLLELKRVLKKGGAIILLDSTPELYINEWASFSTKNFPGNKTARSGDVVKVIMNDVPDKRPVEDVIWFPDDYKALFESANLKLVETHKPLARIEEPYNWIMETKIAPWIIYVLQRDVV
jgi:hypothetical protein